MSMMLEPGTHEDNAQRQSSRGEHEDASVSAMLAIASAINRLAEAVENKE